MPFKRTTFMMKITLPPLPFGAGTRSEGEEAPPLLPTPYFQDSVQHPMQSCAKISE